MYEKIIYGKMFFIYGEIFSSLHYQFEIQIHICHGLQMIMINIAIGKPRNFVKKYFLGSDNRN